MNKNKVHTYDEPPNQEFTFCGLPLIEVRKDWWGATNCPKCAKMAYEKSLVCSLFENGNYIKCKNLIAKNYKDLTFNKEMSFLLNGEKK